MVWFLLPLLVVHVLRDDDFYSPLAEAVQRPEVDALLEHADRKKQIRDLSIDIEHYSLDHMREFYIACPEQGQSRRLRAQGFCLIIIVAMNTMAPGFQDSRFALNTAAR